MTAFDKPVPKALDAITDLVLAFRPKPKSESAKKRVDKSEDHSKADEYAVSPKTDK